MTRRRRSALALLVAAVALGGGACAGADDAGSGDGALLEGIVGACPDAAAFFEERLWRPILSTKCVACHHEDGLAGHTRLVLWDETREGWLEHDFAAVARLATEDVDGTPLLLLKPSGLDPRGHTGGALVQAGTALYADFAAFAQKVAGDCGGAPAVCEAGPVLGARLLRRLDHTELRNTVRDLLGVDVAVLDGLAPDEVEDGYTNNAAALTVKGLLADQYREAAEALGAAAVAERLDALVPCGPAARDRTCAVGFIADFGLRAFRRPLTDEDIGRYLAIYDLAAEDGFGSGIAWVITAMLQSPGFLYRSELGKRDEAAGDGVFALTDWEIATALSYLFWGTTPDEALLEAAGRGELATEAGFSRELARLAADPRAEATMARFAEQWLGTGRLAFVARDPVAYEALTPAVREAMAGQMARVMEAAYADGETLADLLLSRRSFLDPELAALYGVTLPEGGGDAAGFAPVDLSESAYGGLLRLGSVLTVHALPASSSPIHRGKFVRERLLCVDLQPPPPGLVADPPSADPTKSTRERYEAHATDERCATCHHLMDPIGFGFERFDGIGRWRADDGGHAIDDAGVVREMPDAGDVPFTGVEGLSELLAGSDVAARCYLRQWVRFGTGARDGACQVDALWAGFEAAGGALAAAPRVIAEAPGFTRRRGGVGEMDTLADGVWSVPEDPPDPVVTEPDPTVGAGSDALTVTVHETTNWGSGYCRQVEVQNPTGGTVTWELVLDAPGSLTTVWNAVSDDVSEGRRRFR
ncbi:MAG: DUF1592 domain-containing protein, partial [Myxococcales bacterium]|nr:DUF1592 domain-containing protein [Myxococcales bacterium]